MASEGIYSLLLGICVECGRSPDKFFRRGTCWLTVYEFFVCENMLLDLPEITAEQSKGLLGVFPRWRADQIHNGLKAPSQRAWNE